MPMYTKSGRSLWPVVVGALVVVVVGLAAALVAVVTRDAAPDPAVQPSAAATHTHEGVPGGTPELGDAPTGCLAGPGRDADMLLSTQAEAPHTSYGAVEMAAAYMRWANRYPMPGAAQIETVQDRVVSPDANPSVGDLAAAAKDAEANESMRPEGHPYGTRFFTSSRIGQWLVDPASTEDRVTVHLSLGVVVDGALSEDAYGIGSPVFEWVGGGWRFVDMVPTDLDALDAGGTSFTGGC